MQPTQSAVALHRHRAKIVDQILSGVPYRDIASWTDPKVSPSAIARYARNVAKPAAKLTTLAPVNTKAFSLSVDRGAVQSMTQASPVRQRLESVWSKTTGLVDQCDVDNGAPILNAATKQVELLARLTGELKDNTGASLTLNIVCPAGEDKQRVDFSDPDAIEMGFE